jgi:hypothetical protein
MAAPIWQFLREVTVPAKALRGYWTNAVDYVEYPGRLLLEAPDQRRTPAGQDIANRWRYGDHECGADGDPRVPINVATSLLPAAPPAALIAKVGGSRAGKDDGVVIFVAGSYCVYELADKQRGPLYLTMNTDAGFPLTPAGEILVRISQSA